jgi:hypothetical protein
VFLFAAREASERTAEILAAEPIRVPSEAIIAITMSAFATEAFINELAVAARLTGVGRDRSALIELLSEVADALDKAEEGHLAVQEKYQLARTLLAGAPFPKDEAPYQAFHRLFQLRDALVHPKFRDFADDNGFTMIDMPVLRGLQQRGFTRSPKPKPSDPPGGMSWIMQLQTPAVARWAFEPALEMIVAMALATPDDGMRAPSIYFFKNRAATFPN